MKNLLKFICLLLIFPLVFNSCRKDDEDTSGFTITIDGTEYKNCIGVDMDASNYGSSCSGNRSLSITSTDGAINVQIHNYNAGGQFTDVGTSSDLCKLWGALIYTADTYNSYISTSGGSLSKNGNNITAEFTGYSGSKKKNIKVSGSYEVSGLKP